MEEHSTTGGVARRLSLELGILLAEGQLQGILRRRPEIAPPLVRGRRRWRPEDVDTLRAYLARTRCQPSGGGPAESESEGPPASGESS
jgi:hypothetical protein